VRTLTPSDAPHSQQTSYPPNFRNPTSFRTLSPFGDFKSARLRPEHRGLRRTSEQGCGTSKVRQDPEGHLATLTRPTCTPAKRRASRAATEPPRSSEPCAYATEVRLTSCPSAFVPWLHRLLLQHAVEIMLLRGVSEREPQIRRPSIGSVHRGRKTTMHPKAKPRPRSSSHKPPRLTEPYSASGGDIPTRPARTCHQSGML
jgi:hypothetical protein